MRSYYRDIIHPCFSNVLFLICSLSLLLLNIMHMELKWCWLSHQSISNNFLMIICCYKNGLVFFSICWCSWLAYIANISVSLLAGCVGVCLFASQGLIQKRLNTWSLYIYVYIRIMFKYSFFYLISKPKPNISFS